MEHKLTLEEAVANHKKLWLKIAEIVEKDKSAINTVKMLKKTAIVEVFPELKNAYIESGCFLCEFVRQNKDSSLFDCGKCPMVEKRPVECLNGLYQIFYASYCKGHESTAVSAARQIARLPVINPLYK